ncbi:hypothetical protein SAMD00019534_046490 [Acytostelium subglobosum LB1]|uniref:hypothetical protein n=1 Tax=Acytostelium subglobosum LB1 TaxID=1410327 RepID=UPI000645115B|nr:hypothetical protein SAMD00019534_046490 [Acytostelium subglobosum LB1]GAM21474.1 hypothetical protein SAMD00019534_046490 [Acytostelium subglobosum LB1]|eukprot:XP_012755593.1 hypothetical protein SAMD00019534_046490 [Acytostelium subglobosum LB1]
MAAHEDLERIKMEMQAPGGLEVKDRQYMLKTYQKCFVGYEAVDWIFGNVIGLKSREEAIILGQKLLDNGTFDIVSFMDNTGTAATTTQAKLFKDDYLFYSFRSLSLSSSSERSTPNSSPLNKSTPRLLPPLTVNSISSTEATPTLTSAAAARSSTTPSTPSSTTSSSTHHSRNDSGSEASSLSSTPNNNPFYSSPKHYRQLTLLKDELFQLGLDLMHSEKGIRMQRRKKNFMAASINCFSGTQLIEWLMTRLDIGRRDATSIGGKLMNLNIFFEIGTCHPTTPTTTTSTSSSGLSTSTGMPPPPSTSHGLANSMSSSMSSSTSSSSSAAASTGLSQSISSSTSASFSTFSTNSSSSSSSSSSSNSSHHNNNNSTSLSSSLGISSVPQSQSSPSLVSSKSLEDSHDVFYEFITKPEAIISYVSIKRQSELHLAHKSLSSVPVTIINTLNYLKSLAFPENSVKIPPKSVTSKGFAEVMGYLRDMIDGSQPLPHLKLIVLGSERTGKTSLVRALTKYQSKTLSKQSAVSYRRQSGTVISGASDIVTQQLDPIETIEWRVELPSITLGGDNGVSTSPKASRKSGGGTTMSGGSGAEKKRSLKLMCTDFRFNNPDVYWNTHQFFLSEQAFYLITFDINKDPLSSSLDFWVNSVKAKAPNAPIYIVATHLDAMHLSGSGDVIMRALHQVEAFLKERALEVTGVIGVSTTTQRNMDMLRQEIITTLLQQHSTWINEKVPAVYAQLETLLQDESRKRTPPIVSWGEYVNIAKMANITLPEKLERATKTLHRWGSIIWLADDDKSLFKDFVILNPQWLSDCFAALVMSKHTFISSDSTLSVKKLKNVWRSPIVPEELHIVLVKILERFNIVYPLKDSIDYQSPILTEETRTVSSPLPKFKPLELAAPAIISSSSTATFLASVDATASPHTPTSHHDTMRHRSTDLSGIIRFTKIIIPSLLPQQKPSHLASMWDTWSGVDELQIGRYYQFTNAPKSCFERLMVRFLYLMEPIVCWRTGILFRKPQSLKDSVKNSMSSCGTLVEFDPRTQQLQIRVRGHEFDSLARLFQIVLENVDTLLKDQQGFSPALSYVPCACTVKCRDAPTLFEIGQVEASFVEGVAHITCPSSQKLMCIAKIAPDVTLSSVPSTTKISFDDIKGLEQIGAGASAKVFKGTLKGEQVAVKKLNLDRMDVGSEQPTPTAAATSSTASTPLSFQRQSSSSSISSTSSSEDSSSNTHIQHQQQSQSQSSKLSVINEFRREVWLMSDLTHSNIVHMKGFCIDPYSIVMEYMDLGSLSSYLRKKREANETLPWSTIFKIAKDIASGMAFLHNISPPLVHRDLKSPNILLSTQPNDPNAIVAKVSDFGLSRTVVQGFVSKVVDNPMWLAPEVLNGYEYNEKGDIYSFGVIMWELFHMQLPFEEFNIKFMSTLEDHILNGLRPTISPLCNKAYAALITKCWSADPQSRPPFPTIVKQLDEINSQLQLQQQ